MARRIKILPDTLANQIAAGEVVERPASVVKELIENALDAAATRVDIAIQNGGKTEIRVADDGCGMGREDALLALDRHATSKIQRESDLGDVHTFGFRGEALPSIASVARLVLETAEPGDVGTRVRAAGGRIHGVEDCARQGGTTVVARNLFFNVPARAKFMRSAAVETRAVADVVTTLALANLSCAFRLESNGRVILELPSAPDLVSRVAGIWGDDFAGRLLALSLERDGTTVAGLIERPDAAVTGPRRVHLFVGGRSFHDRDLVQAAERAYRTTVPHGARPSLLLYLEVPAGGVDVNVHPAKAEVRFRDRNAVADAVEAAVREALASLDSAATFDHRPPPPQLRRAPATMDAADSRRRAEAESASQLAFFMATGAERPDEPVLAPAGPAVANGEGVESAGTGEVGRGAAAGRGGEGGPALAPTPGNVAAADAPPAGAGAPPAGADTDAGAGAGTGVDAGAGTGVGAGAGAGAAASGQASALAGGGYGPATGWEGGRPSLWQVHDTYILAETRGGLVIIDQHSAHERILFEEMMRDFSEGGQTSQRLLFPLTLRLSPAEYAVVEEMGSLFDRAGFEVEPFGGRTVIVHAAPAPHPYFDAERCLREMITELASGSELTRAAHNQHERIAMTFACKAAIKAGQRLSVGEMTELFDRLFATELPSHDVHGRPTVVRLSLQELERRFGRHG